MALKKVIRPILRGPIEAHEKMLAADNSEGTVDEDPSHEDSLIEPIREIKEEREVTESPVENARLPINRVIKFSDEMVKLLRRAKVAEGSYFFEIDSVTSREGVQGNYGPYDQYLLTFSLLRSGEDVPNHITIPYTISSNPDSPLMQFLINFKCVFEGQSITIQQLIGLKGGCDISHYMTDSGDEYERLAVRTVEKLKK
ncbi:hypothetical protein [Paraliobacillus zengyii]|uniref:hypothetical protein n=1 Tax=Paraliobacillus zengyii TaxID=2213194 RepID=UPI000DD3FCA3|nr:hypothetical protein [Paraliobacillus zengyii]